MLLKPERWRMTKLLGSGVHLGHAAWSQIQSLFITTFNLKLNRDTALTIICYDKIKVKGLGFYSALYDLGEFIRQDHAA